jgi:hypothetical protein
MKQGSLRYARAKGVAVLPFALSLLMLLCLPSVSAQSGAGQLQCPEKSSFAVLKISKSGLGKYRQSVHRRYKRRKRSSRWPANCIKNPIHREASSPSITSQTLEQTLDYLSTITPGPFFDDDRHGQKYLWEYTRLRFDGCTLMFNDRWHLSQLAWVRNTVSLTDLKEDEIQLEHQGTGVGLRLNTWEYRFKREEVDGDFRVDTGTYYVNFGDQTTSQRVSVALAHAIRLCKSRKAKESFTGFSQ